MKRTIYRAIVIALVLGFGFGVLSWWLGQQLMAYKPLEDSNLTKQDPILHAFKGTGAKFEELKFIGWAQINKQYLAEENLISLAKEVAANFGSLEEFVVEVQDDQGRRQIKLLQPNIRIMVQSKAGVVPTKAETYCTINITTKSLANYQVRKRQLEESLKNVEESNKGLSTVITGWYSGIITAKGMKNIANKTLALAEAKIVEGIGDKNLLSISAYTPQIENKIRINDHEININVALRANTVDKRTYIYLGSPIIAREY